MKELVGWTAFSLAAAFAAINFYLSFLRYPIYRLLGWKYKWESGIPGIGSIFVLIGVACLWARPIAWLCAILISALDTGGIPWFALVMICAYFFWKKPQDTPPPKVHSPNP